MKSVYSISLGTLLAITILFIGCTPYVVTIPLEEAIETSSVCCIGAITDELPLDIEDEDKPTAEEIEKFKVLLQNELIKTDILVITGCGDPESRYEVTGGILEYKRGSGAVRFLIGFGLGNAKLLVTLKLVDRTSRETVFAGNFPAEVGDWLTGSDKIYNMVAKNFAKAVKKQQKKALEGK